MTTTYDEGAGTPTGRWASGGERKVRARIHGVGRRAALHPLRPEDQDVSQSQEARVLAAAARRVLAVEALCGRRQGGLVPLQPAQTRGALALIKEVQPPGLALPSVVPSHRGDLQLDWYLPGSVVEVQFAPDGGSYVAIESRDGQEVYEGDLNDEGRRWVRKELEAALDAGLS